MVTAKSTAIHGIQFALKVSKNERALLKVTERYPKIAKLTRNVVTFPPNHPQGITCAIVTSTTRSSIQQLHCVISY